MVSPLLCSIIILHATPSLYISIPKHTLSVGWLEGDNLSVLSEWDTQLEKSGDNLGEIVEERIVILSVLLDPWHEALILDQNVIGWQHHQRLRLLILQLLWSIPLLPLPALLQQKSVVIVGQDCWGESPWTLESRAISVAASQGMGAGQSNDLLVVEAHAAEDVAEVLGALGGIWETSVWSAGGDVLVGAAWTVWDCWAGHLLDGADAGEDPEIGVGDPWELLCLWLSVSIHLAFFGVRGGTNP